MSKRSRPEPTLVQLPSIDHTVLFLAELNYRSACSVHLPTLARRDLERKRSVFWLGASTPGEQDSAPKRGSSREPLVRRLRPSGERRMPPPKIGGDHETSHFGPPGCADRAGCLQRYHGRRVPG